MNAARGQAWRVARVARLIALLAGVQVAGLGVLPPSWRNVGLALADQDHRSIAAPEAFQRVAADSFSSFVLGENRVGITITNYGFIGNNFNSRTPSFEYPLGQGYEHLVRAGLWIAGHALNPDNGSRFYGVTTGTVDGSTNDAAQGATEFTPSRTEISTRSTLLKNPDFNRDAVSEKDLIAFFNDKTPKRSGNNPEDHHPMRLDVRQENYSWSFGGFQHFVVFHWVIVNDGPPIDSMWVGVYGELASGPKTSYNCWPPTSTCSNVGTWFSRKLMAYDDTLRTIMEHYCALQPVPDGCMFDRVPPWAGYKILTPPDTLAGQKITLAAWNYAPGDDRRDTDLERHAIMTAGTIATFEANELQPQFGDPVELLAIGPFFEVNPGDSVVFDVAFVGGDTQDELRSHARTAQRAYDLEYNVPVPPPSPRFKMVARDRALDFYWDNSPESTVDPTSAAPESLDFEGYRLYLGSDRQAPTLIAQFDKATPPNDTTGFNTGFDAVRLNPPVVLEGTTYQYRYTASNLRDGFKYYAAVTSYDLGTPEDESLESGISQNKTLAIPGPAKGEGPASGGVTVYPNPYRVEARWDQGRLVRDHYLWFANLPEACTIKIFTLSGDLVFETHFDGATYHGEGSRGIYNPATDIDVNPPTLSGRTYGWNLISSEGQAVATGLYLYSVEAGSGKSSVGKLLIVKSDRETK